MSTNKLDFSIPANNQKIIELYNKIKKDELIPNTAYQRKLVWRKQHKFKFIETILLNYPFPEIYLAPGVMDTDTLILQDEIVDGQQRLSTIASYIEGKDVFTLNNTPIKKFADLSKQEKEDFLNYEISVRYLKNANSEQIREIFQRINSTEYSLNKTERLNAQWGDSEFICFTKQLIEEDLDLDPTLINYKILDENRVGFLAFFHRKYKIFTENDINRMLALQYMLTLIATLCEGEYFRRNDRVQSYIETYFEDFALAADIETNLKKTIDFIDSLQLSPKSYWFNKANIFTLIVECYKYDTDSVNRNLLTEKLVALVQQNDTYLLIQAGGSSDILPPIENSRYFDVAKEAVNDKTSRDYRGEFINSLIRASIG